MIAAVALGSNLGDRREHLDYAIARLQSLLSRLRVSTYRETVPVGVTGPQPLYLNAAAAGETTVSARILFASLQDIERERGRERPFVNAPRTLDLDLILFGDAVISEPDLIVPHPRFRERSFVLEPLAEIVPDLLDPVSGLTVRELSDRLRTSA